MSRLWMWLVLSAVSLCLPSLAAAETIPPDFKKAVTFIFLADASGNLMRDARTGSPIAYGTGFFVGLPDSAGIGAYGYLVTAKHVLKGPNGEDLARVYIRLNKLLGDAEFVPIDLVANGHTKIYTSTETSVDIAVVPALPSLQTYDLKLIPIEFISTKKTFDEFNISEGTEAFFIGLFTTYYGDHKNKPVVRFGHVAMFPDDPITWSNAANLPPERAQLYLIESQSYGGNSGSPVFFSLGADRTRGGGLLFGAPLIKLAGVMRGRFNDASPIAFLESPTNSTPVALQNNGIAAVTPSYFLVDILLSDELKKFRDDHPIKYDSPKN